MNKKILIESAKNFIEYGNCWNGISCDDCPANNEKGCAVSKFKDGEDLKWFENWLKENDFDKSEEAIKELHEIQKNRMKSIDIDVKDYILDEKDTSEYIIMNLPQKKDNVNHPSHYAETVPGIECIDVTQNFNFNKGNAIKYIWRAGHKTDEIEDLRKAIWYIENEINRLKNNLKKG